MLCLLVQVPTIVSVAASATTVQQQADGQAKAFKLKT
jgi:hypothetical protein